MISLFMAGGRSFIHNFTDVANELIVNGLGNRFFAMTSFNNDCCSGSHFTPFGVSDTTTEVMIRVLNCNFMGMA
ncbi:hypothetical protein CDL12_07451 [Handroanthus impetiginosus]|uniref:Uncharacterized protein n=1 Tax=Handroanthus impetiginosus TaxID=429701 RepID=A0A2G9HQR6_9LAMI|nr:hypothetical protein CDL12_07451 [Handroanthus impetiginosus]